MSTFYIFKQSAVIANVRSFKHDTPSSRRVTAFNYTISHDNVVGAIRTDRVFWPGDMFIIEIIEVLHYDIVTILELDA